MNKVEELAQGTWILLEYGFDAKEFYVSLVSNDEIELGRREWLSNDKICLSKDEIQQTGFEIIGKGKKREWRRFIPKFVRELICPYSRVTLD